MDKQSGSKVVLQTIALENTSIKVGPARKVKNKGKMARRSKRSRRRDNYDRLVSAVFRVSQPCEKKSFENVIKIFKTVLVALAIYENKKFKTSQNCKTSPKKHSLRTHILF